jgi:hypothetical protein
MSIRIKWTGHVAYMGERRGAYGVLVRNNIKMDLQEEEWRGMDWTALAQDRNT